MSETDPYYLKIERFVSNEMSQVERQVFEKQLLEDASLFHKWQAYQLADQLVFENKLLTLKEATQKVHLKSEASKRYLKYGALVTAFLVIVLWSYQSQKVQNGIPTVQQYVKAPLTTSLSQSPKLIKESQVKIVHKQKRVVIPPVTLTTETELAEGAKIQQPNIANINVKEAPTTLQRLETSTQLQPATKDQCAQVQLFADQFVTPACEEKNNGQVIFKGFKGGQAPYSYEVYHLNGTEATANALEKGTYTAFIKDSKGCQSVIQSIEIKEQKCSVAISFNPFIGETWQIPVHAAQGELVVLDKVGNLFFSTNIPAGTELNWDGNSLSGELKTGYFLFHIQYGDGSLEQGTISIVR